MEYNKKIVFFKNHGENEIERVVSEVSLIFEKALYDVKAKYTA